MLKVSGVGTSSHLPPIFYFYETTAIRDIGEVYRIDLGGVVVM